MHIRPNTEAYEREIVICPSGFREYDVRWLYPEQINLRGFHALGMGIGTIIQETAARPDIVTGHDYRSYSAAVKYALISGLMASGCRVRDIGLAITPAAYFAQFKLDCPSVAMVTASHNENGWTGAKIGTERPLTFSPENTEYLKNIVLDGRYIKREGGSYAYEEGIKERYISDLSSGIKLSKMLRVVAACGNGTAGIYAPEALRRIGCEVIEMDCEPDYNFPSHNPNPEDLRMLGAVRKKVMESGADLGIAFDGDGDRCGVIDDTGEEIFADKIGVLLARYLSAKYGRRSRFIVDIKSTCLFMTDPELAKSETQTEYWKTGHSYIKRRLNETNALAGFEKSGHFFFNGPLGRGYDDGILSAVIICCMVAESGYNLSELKESLQKTWSTPTMSPDCPDESKYAVVEKFTVIYRKKMEMGEKVTGKKIRELIDVNGVRIVLEDGTWGLLRASSNRPGLVVVAESPVSEASMISMFKEIDGTLEMFPEVGKYDQRIITAA